MTNGGFREVEATLRILVARLGGIEERGVGKEAEKAEAARNDFLVITKSDVEEDAPSGHILALHRYDELDKLGLFWSFSGCFILYSGLYS